MDYRKTIVGVLRTRQWFKMTDKETQSLLIDLPADCDGFLSDLANRPEEIGNIRMIKLEKLLMGNYILTPIFEVEAIQTKQRYTFEFASWKHGSAPGKCRGIIFLEENNKIKYFAVRRSDRFALSRCIYDALGAVYSHSGDKKELAISKKMEMRLRKVLHLPRVNFKSVIDLGIMYSDSGMSSVSTQLFAAIIDVGGHSEQVIRQITQQTYDLSKIQSEAEIFPIEDLIGFVNKTDDSFLLAAISRVVARGIVPNLIG